MPVLPVLIERNPPAALLSAIDEFQIRARRDRPVNTIIQPTVSMRHLVREIKPVPPSSQHTIHPPACSLSQHSPRPLLPVRVGQRLNDVRRRRLADPQRHVRRHVDPRQQVAREYKRPRRRSVQRLPPLHGGLRGRPHTYSVHVIFGAELGRGDSSEDVLRIRHGRSSPCWNFCSSFKFSCSWGGVYLLPL